MYINGGKIIEPNNLNMRRGLIKLNYFSFVSLGGKKITGVPVFATLLKATLFFFLQSFYSGDQD